MSRILLQDVYSVSDMVLHHQHVYVVYLGGLIMYCYLMVHSVTSMNIKVEQMILSEECA